MKYVCELLIGVAVVTCAVGQPPQCSDECTRYILDNPNGPGVLRVLRELSMPDEPGTQKSHHEMDNHHYELSPPKKTLVDNALEKGLPTDLMRKMLDQAGILPTDTETTTATPGQDTSTLPTRQLRSEATTVLPSETPIITTTWSTTTTASTTSDVQSSTSEMSPSSWSTTPETPPSTWSPTSETPASSWPSTPEMPPTPETPPSSWSTASANEPGISSTPSTVPSGEEPGDSPNETINPPRYQISTRDNGDLVLSINGTELLMPEELPRLNQIVKNPQLLVKIVDDLKKVGVPIKSQGNQVSVDRDAQSTSDEPIYLQIFTSNGRPFKVIIKNKMNQYELPGDEDAFNNLLATQPQIAYQILSLLAAHGITARIDQSHNFGIPDLIPNEQPQLSPPVFHRPVVPRNNLPTSRTPPNILVGGNKFSFPKDWERLRDEVEGATLPAAKVQRALEADNIDCPPHVFVIIYQNMLQDFDNKMEVVRRENELGMNVGSRFYPMPQEAENVAFMMRNDLLACEFVRDSLMRVGIESFKDNGGLEITLPQNRGSFFMSKLPSFRLFEYKVIPNADGSIKVICGPDSYTLPEDQSSLQKAMESRKVLPLEMVDAMNKSGLPARMDYLTQNFEVQNGPQTLRFPVKRRAGPSTNVKLYSVGKPGNMSFLIELDDDQLTIPKDIRKLNSLIINNRLDPLRLVELFKQRTYVPYYFDTEKGRHVLILDGEPLEFVHSSRLNYRGSPSTDSFQEDDYRRQ